MDLDRDYSGDSINDADVTGKLRFVRRDALQKLRELEAEIREQASGSQDGYLLDVANRMRAELSKFT